MMDAYNFCIAGTSYSPTIIIGRERSFFTGRISDDNFNVSYTVGLRPGSSVGHTGAYHATKRDEYATIVWLLQGLKTRSSRRLLFHHYRKYPADQFTRRRRLRAV